MPLDTQLPSPWKEFLTAVDAGLSTVTEIHCLGGFVLTVMYGVPRTTADLDYFSAIPNSACEQLEALAGRESELAKKTSSISAAPRAIPDVPEEYGQRLKPLNAKCRFVEVETHGIRMTWCFQN